MKIDLSRALLVSVAVAVLAVGAQAADDEENGLLQCYVCGGTDNKCSTKTSLGTITDCLEGAETCLVTSSSDATYRRCGQPVEIESYAECKNIGIGAQGAQDATACWCRGDLCNGSVRLFLSTLLLSTMLFSFIF